VAVTDFLVCADADHLALAAANLFVKLAREAIAQRQRFTVGLAGGSTPRPAYSLLAEEPLIGQVDWSQVEVFWGDERCVPPSHPDSNYRMARQSLLDRVPIPPENVHRVRGELPPEDAAAHYRLELQTVLGAGGRFDLILLGMGTDGHTASLFPETAVLDEKDRSFAAVYVEQLDSWRLTLTLPTVNAARHVVFVVSGVRKAETLARVRSGEGLPAARVQPAEGELIWLVDRDAGVGLTRG